MEKDNITNQNQGGIKMGSIFDKLIGIMGFGDDDMDDDYSSEQIQDDTRIKHKTNSEIII